MLNLFKKEGLLRIFTDRVIANILRASFILPHPLLLIIRKMILNVAHLFFAYFEDDHWQAN